jgi:hypothetical protein
MTSRDPRPSPSNGQSHKRQHKPLLGQRTDHDRSDYPGDDLERVDGDLTEAFSRQSSFELADVPFESISSQRSSPWTVRFHRYVSSFSTPILGWRNKSEQTTGNRSRPVRVGLYFIAIALMMLSVFLCPSSPSQRHQLIIVDFIAEA